MDVPDGTGDFGTPNTIRRKGFIICNLPKKSRPSAGNVLQHFWADAGSRVTIEGDEPITFIVSITPGEVLAVKAYKEFNGERTLTLVPASLYTVETVNYGSVTAVQVTTTKPLSTIEDQGWEDQIYVSFESTIGPNPVDILEYIIDNYTDLTYDSTSFDAVKTSLTNLGNNMAILDRRNTVDLIRDIAFLNRCAVWVSNGVFYLKYLPLEPASDLTITTADFRFRIHRSEHCRYGGLGHKVRGGVATERGGGRTTEDHPAEQRLQVRDEGRDVRLVHTQPTGHYSKVSHVLDDSHVQLVEAYQLQTDSCIYCSWKPSTLSTLDMPDYVASSAVKSVVEDARYDSNSQSVKVTCLVPVRTGEMEPYELFLA